MHEAAMHDENCFLTLTYDDKYLPPGGSLDRAAFPLFMKRLRKAIYPQKVRYFHVGEYGETRNRPHYHALLFGFDPVDKALFSVREGFPVFTSALLRETWPFGLHELGSVTEQSAMYVARYVQKKMTGSWAKLKYGDREPEYGTMSRNPGIGARWIDAFKSEVFPSDAVVVRGGLFMPPRYYCSRVASSADGALLVDDVKLKRFMSRKRDEETVERLAVREQVALAEEALAREGGL
jgi:hypothetical protein